MPLSVIELEINARGRKSSGRGAAQICAKFPGEGEQRFLDKISKGHTIFEVYNWIFINKFLKNLLGESYVMPPSLPLCASMILWVLL